MQENSSNQAKKISDARQQSLNKLDKLTQNDKTPNNLSTKVYHKNHHFLLIKRSQDAVKLRKINI